ncbi:PREDICTED: coiled-coil domain-containing protein 63, partial [Tauraco erythrolophus]|uniref:coiled-coil domain-containing protein 63 n=1 Tax=Tauraco erythrolophus TaxID=121530 RepID=UPI0005233B9C
MLGGSEELKVVTEQPEMQGGSSLKQKAVSFSVKNEEMLAEAEIQRLQKQFQIAAEKRKSYGANVRRQMEAQRQEIESLTQEHKDLSLTLSQISSKRNEMQENKRCVELQGLLEIRNQCDSLITKRKAKLADLDKQIPELEKEIVRQMALKVEEANSSKQLQKQMKMLEMRLNHVTVQFDTTVTRNSMLRDEIESLWIQKKILDKNYLKINKKLDHQRRGMDAAVKECKEAYEQRMEALARISSAKEQHAEDTSNYNIELQERKRVLAQDTKLKSFMFMKSTDRSELEQQAKAKKALKAAKEEKQFRWETFESWEVTYEYLLEMAKDRDLDGLVNSFLLKEHNNFVRFSSVVELNNEIERMQQRIRDLQNEIASLVREQEDAESSSLDVLKELEEKLGQTTEEANWHEDKCKESSRVVGQLKSTVEALFKKAKCDLSRITTRLGENGEMSPLNVQQFF